MQTASSLLASAIRDATVNGASSASGVPRRSVQSILEGSTPSVDRAQKIATALGLEFYIGKPRTAESENRPAQTQRGAAPGTLLDPASVRDLVLGARYLMSVLVSFNVADGLAWGPPDEDGLHAIGDGWFKMDWMARQGTNAAHCGATEMHGREMEPTILDGSAILVDRDRRQPVSTGIFMIKGGFPPRSDAPLVRRLRRSGDGWSMYGDHPLCPAERLPHGAVVVGQVVWSAREHLDDHGSELTAPYGERQLRENLATVVSLLRGLTRSERTFLLGAARELPIDDLLRVGLDASRAVLESAKEPDPA